MKQGYQDIDKSYVYAVGTQPGAGRGGISSALVGFVEALESRNVNVVVVGSHREADRSRAFLEAARTLGSASLEGQIVWLHCGRWGSILRKALLGALAKLRGGRLVFHLHSQALDGYLRAGWSRFLLAPVIGMADRIIVLTPWWRARVVAAFPWASERISICPNPLDQVSEDLAHRPMKEQNPSGSTTVRVLTLTRLVRGKGVESVVRGMARLPREFTLTIAGEGPLKAQLERITLELGLNERVNFVGWVSGEEKLHILESSDVFCLPSRHDSFGMTYIEAMAAGLPVVALRYQAIPDVVPPSAGILLDDDSPQSIAGGIIEAYRHKAAWGRDGKRHVREAFSRERIATELLRCFAGLPNDN